MMWGWHGDGWWWLLMSAGMLMFWALVVCLLVLLVRGGRVPEAGPSDPEAILAARYARGDIDAAEYQERQAVLRGAADRTTG